MTLSYSKFNRNLALLSAEKNSPALRRGSRGAGIQILQQALIDLGFYMPRSIRRNGSPDGIFGSETVGKVRDFQSANKPLVDDGIVGGNTIRRLDKLIFSASKSKPVPAREVVRIMHHVPMVRQGPSPICWLACAAMIMSFKLRRSVSVGEINDGFEPSNSSMINPMTSWHYFYTVLKDLGFSSIGPYMSPNVNFIVDLLRKYGPFMLVHYAEILNPKLRGVGTHAIVITGINTNIDKVYFNNPWGFVNDSISINVILNSMYRLWSEDVKSVAYFR